MVKTYPCFKTAHKIILYFDSSPSLRGVNAFRNNSDFKNFKQSLKQLSQGIPWWSSGQDPALSLPRRQVQSLVGEPANCGTPSPAPKKNYPSHLPFTSPTQIASHHSDAKSSLPALRPEVCRIFALLATIHQGHNLECTLLNEALCWPVNEKNDKWLMPPGNLEYKIQSTRKQKQVKLC